MAWLPSLWFARSNSAIAAYRALKITAKNALNVTQNPSRRL
jgi:hypothetical protein